MNDFDAISLHYYKMQYVSPLQRVKLLSNKKVKWLKYPTEHSIKLQTTKMLVIRLLFTGRSDGSYALLLDSWIKDERFRCVFCVHFNTKAKYSPLNMDITQTYIA